MRITSSLVQAEVTYAEVEGEDNITVIKMIVTPAAEPQPPLKHRFVARDIDLKPGNAAPYYYRAIIDLPRRMEALRKKYDEDEELSKWYGTGSEALPVDQLPVEKVRDAVSASIGGAVWEQLVEATQRRDCDFQLGLSEIRGIELITVLLEEFQRSREISRMLAMRTRLAISERRFDDAVETTRMNYRLAHDFGSVPFIVSGLIGIAESGVTNATLLELIAAPDSPNLYWSLSELRQPMIDMRPAIRFELDFGPRMFPFIHRAETTDRSHEEWNRLFRQAFSDLSKIDGQVALFGAANAAENEAGTGIAATAVALLGYSHAKAKLIEQGVNRERVETMGVGHVMAIYTERNYLRLANEYEKLWYMPFWEMQARARELDKQLDGAGLLSGGEDRELMPLVSLLLPAMHAARSAQVRLERDIAAMRVIEALRMYAAAYDGRLPARLEDIEQVPLPPNPATGKPFVYRLDNGTAILELPASEGTPGYNRRFEIQVANK
jgi:hypothetical protein